jgi:hypothetical protein
MPLAGIKPCSSSLQSDTILTELHQVPAENVCIEECLLRVADNVSALGKEATILNILYLLRKTKL